MDVMCERLSYSGSVAAVARLFAQEAQWYRYPFCGGCVCHLQLGHLDKRQFGPEKFALMSCKISAVLECNRLSIFSRLSCIYAD